MVFLPRGALAFYKKALRTNPNCPASVRLGLGLCFLKLGNESKARDAFERAQELDGNCVGALVGQAILDLNTQKKKAIQDGVKKLSKVFIFAPFFDLLRREKSSIVSTCQVFLE